jgi:uncharacterized Zn-binding protein involved in type VI secretion
MHPLATSKCAGRVLMALAAMTGILLISGCGSGNPIIHSLGGGFSKSSLKGQYVISQTGIGIEQPQIGNAIAPFSETIVFTADGSGNLNVTVDDFDQVGGPYNLQSSVTGTYSIASDGTGSLNIGGSNGFNYAITMIDDKHFYIIEQDLFQTASGFGEMQDKTAFTAAPSGPFIFKAHEVDTSSRVGGITITAGAIAGTEDFLSLGLLSTSQTVATSVSMTAPDATNGWGKFTLTDGSSFNYYVVNSGKFYIMSNSPSGSLEIGQAEAQVAPAGGFSLATLPGSYVFGSSGDTTVTGSAGIHSAGVFTTDGNGHIESGSSTVPGAVDYVQDTTVNSNLAVSGGTYTLDASGHGEIDLTLSVGTIKQKFWTLNGTRAYFLVNNTAAVEDGTFSQQQGAPFTALSSQAAFVMDGFDVAFKDRVGLFKPTSGGFDWNQAANSFDPVQEIGSLTATSTSGTYTVTSNGRAAVVVNGVTTSVVFYLSSANTGFMVQEDTNSLGGVNDIGGSFTQQASQ